MPTHPSSQLASTSRARHAIEEPVGRRFAHRVPWMLVGLAGALASAAVVAGFEGSLADNVRLAFFVPGIVYMADAVGTQTEASMIRGFSVGVPLGRVFGRELLTGGLIGFALAVGFVPLAILGWGDRELAIAAGIALFAVCSVATLVAMSLPWVLARLGRDPRFGSGPLATVIQDLLSLLIYFSVAAAVLD
jgi:magnesium transporter